MVKADGMAIRTMDVHCPHTKTGGELHVIKILPGSVH